LVSYTSLLGGAELILLDHATALAGPVVLACPEGPLAERARAAGIAVEPLAARRVELRASLRDRIAMPLRIAAQARELRRIVAARQPRCVVAWGMRALLACAPATRGPQQPPLVFQHNDLLPGPLVGRAVHSAARRAELTIALSQAIADDLLDRGRLPAPVEVLRAGVDLQRFGPSAPAPGPPTVLVLSAIAGWKRPDLALETVALVARELPGLRLRVAGQPVADSGARLLAKLERRAAEPDLAGRVDFVGQVDDVPAALAAATCLLHCSDREPYGMALVEALACGRPVVAPAAAGPLEIVDAGCGVLYPPGDAAAAAVALVDAIGRARALGVAARVRAEARFDHATARARFAELIDTVAAAL
jgi:glycosyltransferase involved in cell wall biosynthesis